VLASRVKIHGSFSGVVYLSISLDVLDTRDTTVSPDYIVRKIDSQIASIVE